MALQMIRPSKHPKTGVYRLRLMVPPHLRETTKRLFGAKLELIENLGTKDPAEAKRRAREAEARLRPKLEAAEAALKGEPPRLTERDVQTIAGEWYRDHLETFGDDSGTPEKWEGASLALADQIEPIDPNDPSAGSRVVLADRDRTTARDLLIVWPRDEVVRVDPERGGGGFPGIADGLEGRAPAESLEVLGAVVG